MNQRGFMLIEVLMGALIVGIAAVGVALMLATGGAYIDAEGENSVALGLAKQRIEQIRAMGHPAILATWTPPRIFPVNHINEATIPNHPGYRRITELFCRAPEAL